MKPDDTFTNGDESSESDSSGSGSESDGWVQEEGLPARSLAALNALRKSRQHYDVLLLPGAGGEEVPAHSCVLGAISPALLAALCPRPAPPATPVTPATPQPPTTPAPPAASLVPNTYRVEGVDADSLKALVEFAYSGRIRAGSTRSLRRVYVCAWRLRAEGVCRLAARALLRRVSPPACLPARALPGLRAHERAQLDQYIQINFDSIVSSGALSSLPQLQASVVRGEGGSEAGEGGARLCDAVLRWILAQEGVSLSTLCGQSHVLHADSAGALHDQLPAHTHSEEPPEELDEEELRARRTEDGVVCAHSSRARTVGVLSARGTLLALTLQHTHTGAAPAVRGPVDRPPVEGVSGEGVDTGEERARMDEERCAFAACEMDGELVVCGGYDRGRVLQSCSSYLPALDAWLPRPPRLPAPRARLAAAALPPRLYLLGGSDGTRELSTVLLYTRAPNGSGTWSQGPPLPLALSQSGGAAAADTVWCAGGWAGGRALRGVVYLRGAGGGEWRLAPALAEPRSQCALVPWRGRLWALGGCDSWRCLASTEHLQLPETPSDPAADLVFPSSWQPGPLFPSARRSVAAAVWEGDIYVVGGSDGSNSLRSVLYLSPPSPSGDVTSPPAPAWRAAPPLRCPRAAPAAAAISGVLYVVGGYNGKEFLSCMECLYSRDGAWTSLRRAPPLTPTLSQHEKQIGSSEIEADTQLQLKSDDLTEEVNKMSECSLGKNEVSPDSIVSGTDGIIKGPEGMLKGPDGDVKGPDGTVNGPEGIVNGPDSIVKGPDSIAKGPQGIVKGPQGIVKGPDGIVKGPDCIVKGPNGIGNSADSNEKYPDSAKKNVDRIRKKSRHC